MKKMFTGLFIVCCLATSVGDAKAFGHPLTKRIFKCQRAVVQSGIGGEHGVIQAYDALDDMLYYRHKTLKLFSIYHDCLKYLVEEEPQGVMARTDYYALVNDLNGVHPEDETQEQSKLFILMTGLRDNVAKCVSVTTGGMWALLFGPAVNASYGVCNNLEGEIYSKVVLGWGLNLGFGANVTVFADHQLGVFPEESGDLGRLILKATDSLAESLFQYDGISDDEWPEFFSPNIYATSSLGVGPVYPLSFMTQNFEDEELLENCLGMILRLADDDNQAPDMTLREFGQCLTGSSGVAVGAGINIAIVFDFPLHVKAPFLNVNHVFYDVVEREVSQAEINMIRARTDMLVGFPGNN